MAHSPLREFASGEFLLIAEIAPDNVLCLALQCPLVPACWEHQLAGGRPFVAKATQSRRNELMPGFVRRFLTTAHV